MHAGRYSQTKARLADSTQHGDACELLLVEGESAARSVLGLRDPATQAVLPLQGKPLNACKASAAKVAANPLYRQLAAALGTRDPCIDAPRDPGSGLRYGRIALLFDPDADGVHICALLLLYFRRWMPALLEDGRVLVVRAPMFAITHPRLAEATHAWSHAHAQAILAQWRADGLDGAGMHRYLGLGSIPPPVLDAHCVDPRTRIARMADEQDLAAIRAAFGAG